MSEDVISYDQLKGYVNQAFSEINITECENQLLEILKMRQEISPSEKNNAEWLSFTNWVYKRRYDR